MAPISITVTLVVGSRNCNICDGGFFIATSEIGSTFAEVAHKRFFGPFIVLGEKAHDFLIDDP